jgi:hypothetical protein
MQIPKRAGTAAPLKGVEVRQSEIHGQGVFALRDFLGGEEIGLYAGRRFAPDESHAGWDDQLTYLFGLSDGSVIDGAQGGNATWHINHACSPNVEAVERRAYNDELELVVLPSAASVPAKSCSWTTRLSSTVTTRPTTSAHAERAHVEARWRRPRPSRRCRSEPSHLA